MNSDDERDFAIPEAMPTECLCGHYAGTRAEREHRCPVASVINGVTDALVLAFVVVCIIVGLKLACYHG